MMFCKKCGKQLQSDMGFCPSCGTKAPVAANVHGVTSLERANSESARKGGKNEPFKAVRSDSETTDKETGYHLEGDIAFMCISGIVVALVALFTYSGDWIAVKMPFGGTQEASLLEFSGIMKDIATVTQYFSPDTTSTLNIIAFLSTASFYVLLIGSIIMLIVSVVTLIRPAAEPVAFVAVICNSLVVRAFAVIGAIFVACPVIESQYMAFTPLPLVLLIVAGIPAVIMHVS